MAGIAEIKDLLASTGMNEAGYAPLLSKCEEYVSLVTQSNEWVAQVNAAKAQDPSNVDYLDERWRAKATEGNALVAAKAEEFDAVAEQYEKLLKELRTIARENFIPQALTPEAQQATRKKVNDANPVITEARKSIQAQLEFVENMLKAMGKELPEGGLVSFLPAPDSLKSARGRKAATSSGETTQYATRVSEILLDGKSSNRNGNGKFAYAADALTEKFNGKAIAQNKVTKEEIEEQYFASLPGNVEFRGLTSNEVPDEHTFTFEKTVLKQNGNDDSFTEVPEKVQVVVRGVNYGKAKESTEPAKSDSPKNDNAPGEKAESKPAENKQPMAIDTKSETRKQNEAAAKQPAAKPEAKK